MAAPSQNASQPQKICPSPAYSVVDVLLVQTKRKGIRYAYMALNTSR
jgi:hypothetical protein